MVMVVVDVFGHRLSLDEAHREHIITEHPEMRSCFERLGEVFRAPELVKRSRQNPSVYLYYRFYPDLFRGKYLLGVASVTSPAKILTCYVTDTIKRGDVLWPTH